MDNNQIIQKLNKNLGFYGYIYKILEADYGCEERGENEELKVLVYVLTKEGEVIREVVENELILNNLNENSFIDERLRYIFEK